MYSKQSMQEVLEAMAGKHDKAVDAILENAANGCVEAGKKVVASGEEILQQLRILKAKKVIGLCDTFKEFQEKSGMSYEDAKEFWDVYWEHYEEKENVATGN